MGLGPLEEPIPTTLLLTPSDLAFSSFGETTSITAVVLDQFGTPLDALLVAWLSLDGLVATVSSEGLVAAAGNGSTTIEATVGKVLAIASVVVAQEPASIRIEPNPIILNGPGDTLQAVGNVHDAGGAVIDGQTIRWSSSDAGVLTVDGAGLLTAVATGSATLTATSGSLSTTAPVSVTALPASIVVSTDAVVFGSLGDTVVVTAVVRDGNGEVIDGAAIAWMSFDATIAVVEGGRVAAVGGGSTIVVASAGAVADTVIVDVAQVPATISVVPDPISLNGPGDTIRAMGSVLDAGGSVIPSESVAWATSDPAIVTVDGGGLVTGVAVGETVLTAQSGALSTQVVVLVTQTPATLTLSADSILLTAIGDMVTVDAVVMDGNGDVIQGASVSWASSDSSVASVTGGFVTAVGFGSATITASAGAQVAEVVVAVQQPAQGPSFSQVVNEVFVRRGCTASRCHG